MSTQGERYPNPTAAERNARANFCHGRDIQSRTRGTPQTQEKIIEITPILT